MIQYARIAGLTLLSSLLLGSCGDSSSPTTTQTTTTSVAPVQTTEFTLSARNCFFRTSRQITTLSENDSFSIEFKPLKIDMMDDDTWAHAVQFWLGDPRADDSIALDLIWEPDSEWTIAFIVPDGVFSDGSTELISVGGRFREITFVRRAGLAEWLLDGVVVVQLQDDRPQRAVHTGVVGSDVRFRYRTSGTSALQATMDAEPEGECMTRQTGPCAMLP